MPRVNLGRIGMVPRGPYQATTEYQRLDVVVYENAEYVALQTTTGHPPTDPAYFLKMLDLNSIIQSAVQATENANSSSAAAASAIHQASWNEDTRQLQFFDYEGESIGEPITITGGGGGSGTGGGGISNYAITLTRQNESRTLSAAENQDVFLEFYYSSVDEQGEDDGEGLASVYIDNIAVSAMDVAQGDNQINLKKLLHSGSNNVKLRVENSEGAFRSLSYTVNVVSLSIAAAMEPMALYSGNVTFNYTPIGSGTKTVHFLMDGTEIHSDTVTTTGRVCSYTVPAQSSGGHIFTCYAEITVDEHVVVSNTITAGMMWTGPNTTILAQLGVTECTQGENLVVQYMVYNPNSENTSVQLSVLSENGSVYSSRTETKDRSPQVWSLSDYPAGDITLRISSGQAVQDISVHVDEFETEILPVSTALRLSFDPSGRSNDESQPDHWSYTSGNITYLGSFTGFGWKRADGWLLDDDNIPVLRFLPGDSMTIPIKPFEDDARNTGYTIEVEFATRDVRDYDDVVFSCFSGNRGFRITSQQAELASEQTSILMMFKEDSRLRVTFCVEPRLSAHRLIYVYINGVMSGVVQYPNNDNFQQSNPVGLTIGCETCSIDLYAIRCYNVGLSRYEQLDNYISGRNTLAERVSAYARNNILDPDTQEISIGRLPASLPYMLISCPELPQYKGDKKTGVTVSFVDGTHPQRSFEATGAEMDVQGTSSAGYPVKNFKVKLKGTLLVNGADASAVGYMLSNSSIPVKTFCLKADYASSEGANNVELVQTYETNCPYSTPPQQADSRVRQGIEGYPMIVFWHNTETGDTTFIGKYNFNNDKSTPEVFGFTSAYPARECWEFLNNNTDLCLFRSNDFSNWSNSFEAREPEESTDTTALQRVVSWVCSTWRKDTDTAAVKAEKLATFREEFEDYFVLDACLFYYLFTEIFLMVDSRAKNMFLTTFDGTHWFPFPYDMDTALGINNEGTLSFSYSLEDTDTVGSADVFNGQASALWNNLRDAFPDELKSMYASLRSGNTFNYSTIRDAFEAHQAVWMETVWNEDAFVKYLQPFFLSNVNNLSMLQGSKSSQRDWWLFNAFRYRDSKYQTGDALSHFITLRVYDFASGISITPYSDLYIAVKWGNTATSIQRGYRDETYFIPCQLDNLNDTETYIYSSDRISDVGDLSSLKVGYADFSMAPKLTQIILGSNAAGYVNSRLETLYVGSNNLLTLVNVRSCPNLTGSLDFSGCLGLKTFYAAGSGISGALFADGARLETVELPNTVTNITFINCSNLTSFTCPGYTHLSTLRIENTDNLPIRSIIAGMTSGARVRLIGVVWTETTAQALQATVNKLLASSGMDASGNNTTGAVVTGRVNVQENISASLLSTISEHFPELEIVVNGSAIHTVRYFNYDGTLLYTDTVIDGNNAVDPITAYDLSVPTKSGTETKGYVFSGWSNLDQPVHSSVSCIAQYQDAYRVRFLVDGTAVDTQWVAAGDDAVVPSSNPVKENTAQYSYTFLRWNGDIHGISGPTDITADFTAEIRLYTVRFYNSDGTLLQTSSNIPYGSSAAYSGSDPLYPEVSQREDYRFVSWSPDCQEIHGDTDCYAVYVDINPASSKLLEGTITKYTDDTLTEIGTRAFHACSALSMVSVPAVTFIGANAFYGCTSLTELRLMSPVMCVLSSSNAFSQTPILSGRGSIYVPASLLSQYKSANQWSYLSNALIGV